MVDCRRSIADCQLKIGGLPLYTSFPRKRESTAMAREPRFRGCDVAGPKIVNRKSAIANLETLWRGH